MPRFLTNPRKYLTNCALRRRRYFAFCDRRKVFAALTVNKMLSLICKRQERVSAPRVPHTRRYVGLEQEGGNQELSTKLSTDLHPAFIDLLPISLALGYGFLISCKRIQSLAQITRLFHFLFCPSQIFTCHDIFPL